MYGRKLTAGDILLKNTKICLFFYLGLTEIMMK